VGYHPHPKFQLPPLVVSTTLVEAIEISDDD